LCASEKSQWCGEIYFAGAAISTFSLVFLVPLSKCRSCTSVRPWSLPSISSLIRHSSVYRSAFRHYALCCLVTDNTYTSQKENKFLRLCILESLFYRQMILYIRISIFAYCKDSNGPDSHRNFPLKFWKCSRDWNGHASITQTSSCDVSTTENKENL
jgi:hypothetical protein